MHRRTRECERTCGASLPLPSPNSLELRCASSILEANLNFADGISDPPSSLPLPPRLPNSFFFLGSLLLSAKPSRSMQDNLINLRSAKDKEEMV